MNIVWLRVFREVARRGSLSAAGQSLGYTQSAISRQVAALEKTTGTVLFVRRHRGTQLTEEGRCLLEHAVAVLDRLAAAQRDLEALRRLEAGRLRAGAFDSADAALVPRATAAFRRAHPRVEVTVVEGGTTEQLGRLASADIDVAVIAAYLSRPLDTEELDLHHLLDDPLMVALPATHALARRRDLRLVELADEGWVEGFPDSIDTLIEACLRAGFRPRIDFGVREWTAKQGYVAAGLGVTLVPFLAATTVRPDILVLPLHPQDAPVRKVYAATRHGHAEPASVATFIESLHQAAANLRTGP